jgi:CHRD domain
MRRLGSVLGLILVVGSGPAALADDDDGHKFRATLSGYNEVHFVTTAIAIPNPTPPPATVNVLNSAALRGAVSTGARGKFHATINKNADLIDYELSYEGLEGDVTQAHIHFGQRHTVGGIVVWLCETAAAPAPAAVADATPPCPGPRAGSVTGTIGPAQVLTVVGQGFNAGEAGVFDELVRAIRAGATYANVHSQLFPPGEIRGHIDEREGHHH